MRHFVIELTYTAPLEQVLALVEEHRAFLQVAIDRGTLLFSGPQVPRTGGIIIARALSLELLTEFFTGDPFYREGVAEYRYIEFQPARLQPFLSDWASGA